MKGKRGQFFILAAIILVSILASIFLYKNQIFLVESKQGVKLIGEEVNVESGVVINLYVAKGENNIEEFIIKMVQNLIDRKDSVEMVFIYNLDSNINVFNLAKEDIKFLINPSENKTIESQREIVEFSVSAAGIGTGPITFQEIKDEITLIPLDSFTKNSNLSFIWNGTLYENNWIEDKNIYFVLMERIGEETHVVQ